MKQIRMNEKVPTNLSAGLQKLALRQGCLTHTFCRECTPITPTWPQLPRSRAHFCFMSGVEQTQTAERELHGRRLASGANFPPHLEPVREAQKNSFLAHIRAEQGSQPFKSHSTTAKSGTFDHNVEGGRKRRTTP